jgi:hypothetical protein
MSIRSSGSRRMRTGSGKGRLEGYMRRKAVLRWSSSVWALGNRRGLISGITWWNLRGSRVNQAKAITCLIVE